MNAPSLPSSAGRRSPERAASRARSTRGGGDAARLFRALSDPTRLRILQILRSAETTFQDGRGCGERGEVCVCDFVRVLSLPQPTVSRHLGYLRRTGLVLQRRHGLWNYYRLAAAKTKLHAALFDCVDACRGQMACCAVDARRLSACCVDGSSCGK